jgi:hypothetical protein
MRIMRIMSPVPQPGMIILLHRRRCISGASGCRIARRERAMEQPRVERRLAAVLAADVAGYSRLIGADEGDTLARLRAVQLFLCRRLQLADGGGRNPARLRHCASIALPLTRSSPSMAGSITEPRLRATGHARQGPLSPSGAHRPWP